MTQLSFIPVAGLGRLVPPPFLNFYPCTQAPRSGGAFVYVTATLPWVLKQDDTRNTSQQVICDLEEER